MTEARKIIDLLQGAGYLAYFAGGAVRDMLRGKKAQDYDIATSATPEEVLSLFPGSDAVGKHFGVILVKRGGEAFEVATFRTDGSYRDRRRPETVEFSHPEEDAKRRDFTMNGLFYDPVTEEIIDYVGGEEDIKAGLIRAIGDPSARFQEDALRLMRAVRFSVQTGFTLEAETLKAVEEHAETLAQISVERRQEEFSKILRLPERARGVRMLMETGLMRSVIPEFYDLISCEQPPQFHPEGDVYTHTMLALELLEEDAPLVLSLSVLLHDIGKPATYSYDEEAQRIRFNGHDQVGAEMAEEILTRLRYPNAVIQDVCAIVENHMQFMNVQQMRTAKVKRFLSRPTIELDMELHRVDCKSSNGITENYDFLREKQEEFAKEPIIPEPLITGRDLISSGLKPGPLFREILEDIQTEQLEGRLTTKEEALEYLSQRIS